MKNLTALYAAQPGRPATPFTHSMVQKLLKAHGEKLSTANRIGDYYVHDSMTGTWGRTNDITGMSVIELFHVKGFLSEHGNRQPIPDSVWMEIDEELSRDEDKRVAEIYERVYG